MDRAILADRVDGEPPAILGLSTTELLIVTAAVGVVVIPLLVAIGLLVGQLALALAGTGFFFLGGVYGGSIIFRRLKRGRPHGYYQIRAAILAQRWLGTRTFILRGGHWDVGRNSRRVPTR